MNERLEFLTRAGKRTRAVRVSADVHQRAKVRAAELNLPLREVVDLLLRDWLDETEPGVHHDRT